MKWLIVMGTILFSMTTVAHTKELSNTLMISHTGEPCKTYQTLKKEHPSQRIYWETVEGKKCYHVHVKLPIERNVRGSDGPMGAISHMKSISKDVLDWYSTPTMKWFYDDALRGRSNSGR